MNDNWIFTLQRAGITVPGTGVLPVLISTSMIGGLRST
jgi:hypothetical protein